MDAPSHRACAHCRSQKVRCLPDEANPNVCQRCARTGKQCVFTPLQKRKQRKRTDTRVAELEREMRAMRALLKEKSEGESPDSPSGSGTEMEPIAEDSVGEPDIGAPSTAPKPMRLAQGQSELLEAGRSVLQQSSQQPPQSGTAEEDASSAAGSRGDVVDRGVVPMDIARRLVEHHKRNLYPQYPQVYIPDSCTADELRATRPTLFLAVIAAASENEHPELAKTLDTEVLQEYATRSVVKSEKSVELVQSLLISAVWYVPPSKFGQLKYYEVRKPHAYSPLCSCAANTREVHSYGRHHGCGYRHHYQTIYVEPKQICCQEWHGQLFSASFRGLCQPRSQHVYPRLSNQQRRHRKYRLQKSFPRILCNLRRRVNQSSPPSYDACHYLHKRMPGLHRELPAGSAGRSNVYSVGAPLDDCGRNQRRLTLRRPWRHCIYLRHDNATDGYCIPKTAQRMEKQGT